MYRITKPEQTSETMRAVDMKVGDLGRIVACGHSQYVGHLVLCTYGTIVSLDQPNNTWDIIRGSDQPSFTVELLKRGETITLEVL